MRSKSADLKVGATPNYKNTIRLGVAKFILLAASHLAGTIDVVRWPHLTFM